jgi:hypothetical protein
MTDYNKELEEQYKLMGIAPPSFDQEQNLIQPQ